MRNAFEGLNSFSKIDRILIRIFIAYLFIIPITSVLSYEFWVETNHYSETHNGLIIAFFLPIAMHTGFVLNNLKVGNTFSIAYLTFRVIIELIICHYLFDWELLFSISMIYVLEIFGFCTGLLIGTIFRKANITAAHRIISLVIASFLFVLIYLRFNSCFDEYFASTKGDVFEIIAAAISIVIAAIPYIRIFVLGKENTEIQMKNTPLMQSLNGFLIGLILFHLFIIPLVVIAIIK